LYPQQITLPALKTAHVCWFPAETSIGVRPAGSRAGDAVLDDRVVVEPTPSLPLFPCPQQYTFALLIRTQEWYWPTASRVTVPVARRAFVGLPVTEVHAPVPSWHQPALPQQVALPSDSTAQQW